MACAVTGSLAVAAAVAAAVLSVLAAIPSTCAKGRLTGGSGLPTAPGAGGRSTSREMRTRRTGWQVPIAGLLVVMGAGVWTGALGAAISAPLAGGAAVLARHSVAIGDDRRRMRRAELDVPLVGELLAACLAVGADGGHAASVVGHAIGGDVGTALTAVGASVALGADPPAAWRDAAVRVPALGPLARAVARSSTTGAPLAVVVAGLSDDVSRAQLGAARAAARRVGVALAAPLGLCFLPAFVLLGLVPVIAAVASSLLEPA